MITIVCNKCGKVIEKNNGSFHTISLRFGYGSQHDSETHDSETVEMHFHEHCMDDVLSDISNGCVIKPEFDY